MEELVLNNSQQITLQANQANDYHLSVLSNSTVDLTITFEGDVDCKFDFSIDVEENARFTLLTINHLTKAIDYSENINVANDCEVIVAHAELNDQDVNLNSVYNLNGQGTSLKVLTATLAPSNKKYNQKVFHNVGNTNAEVSNYGVVLSNGLCDLVVKNTIEKGCHGSGSHQTSRLLTSDKTAIGKILPILYIYDNDVQASHAASLGQPNEEQVYYLQSRGLSREEAMRLIVTGYLLPITKIVDSETTNEILKNEIETKVSL